MKKLFITLLALFVLTGCTIRTEDVDYIPPIPEHGMFVYGEVNDKEEWCEIETYDFVLYNVHHYAIVLDSNESDSTYFLHYFIQVPKEVFDSLEVGDSIGIVYGGYVPTSYSVFNA